MNYTYRGIAIRQEKVVNAQHAGYVNYYAREGERVALGDLVYTVDETGRLNEYLQNESMDETTLSDSDLAQLRSEIVGFMHDFDPTAFSSTYSFKYAVKGSVLKLANTNIIASIGDVYGENGLLDMVNFCTSEDTGIVTYWLDGYEDLTPEAVTEEMFEDKDYEKTQLVGRELITQGDPVYKLSTDENWSIVVPIEEEMGRELEAEEYIDVRFLKNQYQSWAQAKLIHGADGDPYLQLYFNNSMITFASDRFVDIELLLHEEVGLKIPNSAIADVEFFLVPEQFLTKSGEDGGEDGVIRESYKEDGTVYSEFVQTQIYNYDQEAKEYYLDTSVLRIGDNLLMPGTQERYTVSRKGSLTGVYNMNKGYADFRQIKILYRNEEYSIVKSNTQYGLNVYDYIVLDAQTVSDAQLLY